MHPGLAGNPPVSLVSGSQALAPFGATLRDAVSFFLPHLKARHHSCKLGALVERLLGAKGREKMSARYLKDLRLRLGAIAEAFPEKLAAEVTSDDVDAWLTALELSPTSRNNYRRVLVVLFNFALEHNFCASNPAEKVGMAKVVDKPPGILVPDDAARLIEATPAVLLPYVAIGLFAGLRRAELERLDWREVRLAQGFIEITAHKFKTARRRLVHIEPNLAAWLGPFVQPSGPVWPQNFEALFERARKDAGIAERPDNALRHSFASYHLAHFSDAARTALELGHSSTRLLFTASGSMISSTTEAAAGNSGGRWAGEPEGARAAAAGVHAEVMGPSSAVAPPQPRARPLLGLRQSLVRAAAVARDRVAHSSRQRAA